MRNTLAFLGALIESVAFWPYLKETLAGTVRPRIASWSTWALVTGIATVAALSERAYSSAALTGVATIIEITIVIAALRKGDRDYGVLDGVSQFISVVGIIAWLMTDQAYLAIIFTITADFFGVVPTLYHSWKKPHDEAWLSFAVSGFGSILSCLAVDKLTVVNLGFPVYLASVGLAMAGLIFIRQRQHPA